MSYQVNEQASLEKAIDFVTSIIAAVGARKETAHLAAPWIELRKKLMTARDERDQDRWNVRGASAKVAVHDAVWDDSVTTLSGHAYLAAGKDATREPYASLFGQIPARDAAKLGVYKATSFGSTTVTKAKVQNHAALTPHVEALAAATGALDESAKARAKAFEAATVHEVKRLQLIEQIESLLATTEVGALTAMPGKRTIVTAMLSWNVHMESKKRRGVAADDEVSMVPHSLASEEPAPL